jgi:RNA polymerase sigma factor (TIGR02999 family)
MESQETSRISLLLGRVSRGENEALGLVFDAAYGELRTLAEVRLRGRHNPRLGLDAAGLVHELFLRLAQRGDLKAQHRAPFFKYAAQVMRSVIIDGARERSAKRRGGQLEHHSFGDDEPMLATSDGDTLRLHEALTELAQHDPELSEVVTLRFFGGLTDDEVAEILGVTDRTVRRRWDRARIFLHGELHES